MQNIEVLNVKNKFYEKKTMNFFNYDPWFYMNRLFVP